jgi:hypothetical protein
MNCKTQRDIHRLTRTRKMAKVCCLGVCEGMNWEEAKEFIIKKHDLAFWKSWVGRVTWRCEDKGVKKENNSQGILFDTMLAEYEQGVVTSQHLLHEQRHKTKLQEWVNGDGVIHWGPGHLIWSLWVENLEHTRAYCNSHQGGRDMIRNKLCECWKYSYAGCGGGRAREFQKFRDSLK